MLEALPFSFGLLEVRDAEAEPVALAITVAHAAQGFTCRDARSVLFHPLIQQGHARIALELDACPEGDELARAGFMRAIAGPLDLASGRLVFEGGPGDAEVATDVPAGRYWMVFAERVVSHEDEKLHVGVFLRAARASDGEASRDPRRTFVLWHGERPATVVRTADAQEPTG